MLGLVILAIKQISGYCGILGNSWNFANAEVIIIHLKRRGVFCSGIFWDIFADFILCFDKLVLTLLTCQHM